MSTYSIKQPSGRFLYGAIMAPIVGIAFLITLILVIVWANLEFVYGIIGAISCIFVVFSMFKLWRKNWYEYTMIKKSNPIPFTIEVGKFHCYEYSKLDAFDFNQPIAVELNESSISEVKGGYNKMIKVEIQNHKIRFDSSMKFIDGSFKELKDELLKYQT